MECSIPFSSCSESLFWVAYVSRQRWSRLPFAFAMTDSGGVTGPNLAAALSPQGPEQGGNSKSKKENVWQ